MSLRVQVAIGSNFWQTYIHVTDDDVFVFFAALSIFGFFDVSRFRMMMMIASKRRMFFKQAAQV